MQFNKTMKLKKEVIIKLSASNSNFKDFHSNSFLDYIVLKFSFFRSSTRQNSQYRIKAISAKHLNHYFLIKSS